MDSKEAFKLAACISLYLPSAIKESESNMPSVISLTLEILPSVMAICFRVCSKFFFAFANSPAPLLTSIEICSSMASMASSISSMASSQSMASADFRLSCAAFKVRLLAFTRGPIWSKERVPSEGMVTEVLPVEDWGCPLSLGARTAAAGADRDSRAEQVRHRAAKRFFIGGSSWRGKGNRLLETGRKCCYFSRVL